MKEISSDPLPGNLSFPLKNDLIAGYRCHPWHAFCRGAVVELFYVFYRHGFSQDAFVLTSTHLFVNF